MMMKKRCLNVGLFRFMVIGGVVLGVAVLLIEGLCGLCGFRIGEIGGIGGIGEISEIGGIGKFGGMGEIGGAGRVVYGVILDIRDELALFVHHGVMRFVSHGVLWGVPDWSMLGVLDGDMGDVPGGVMCAGLFSWIGKAAQGVAGIGTALFGGIKSGKARKRAAKELQRAQDAIDDEKGLNDALFTKQYYQDYLQRSENQAALKVLRDRLKKQNQAASQMAVVTGATPEAVAKQKEAGNEVMGDTVSQIAVHSSSVKDQVLNRYQAIRQNLLGREQALYGQKADYQNQNARQWANLMSNGLNSLTNSFASDGNGSNGMVDAIGKLLNK